METPKNLSMDEEWKEKLQRIKDYLNSLLVKTFKKRQKKVKDGVTRWIEEIFDEWEKDDDWLDDYQIEIDESWTSENSDNDGTKIQDEDTKKSDFDLPPEDQDEYIPQDSEIWETMWEQSRFAEIYPPFLWYYAQWKKSYFNRETNLWSKKKQLKPFSHVLPEWIKKYTYTWIIRSWINAIPLPEWARPDTASLEIRWKTIPEFQVDQNWCVYLISKEKQFVSFKFWLNQHANNIPPILEDGEHIIFDSLSTQTQELLERLKASWWNVQQIAAAIKYYIIKNKKYSTKVQWTLHRKSNRDNYIKNLDESPILECFSANSLFVALCRELWIPARLVVGHMVQSVNKDWKACLSKNDWHARSEIRDDSIWEWIRVDATPTEKEDGEDSNENWQEQNNQNNNQDADNNFWDNQDSSWDKWKNWQKNGNKSGNSQNSSGNTENSQDQEWNSGDGSQESQSDWNSESESSSESNSSQNQSSSNSKWEQRKSNSDQPQKSPAELLDEMVQKAREESLIQQSQEIKDTLDKLEQAQSKEEIRDILDKSKLSDFAKEMVDKVWEDKILDEEKKEMEWLDDERKIDEALQNSLLSEEYKQKLKEYASLMKKKIEDERKKMKSEMEKLWFEEHELQYYKEYKQLEAEVEPEVRRQIKELQKILPVQYQIIRDDKVYRSGPVLEWGKLVEFEVTWDPRVFKRNREVRESNEINMFETIIIDTSWSMWSFTTSWSILRESIKAAIIRAKVLEHFKVDFSIVLFWDYIDEVMSFWEKFSSKWKCTIPARLIRAAHKSWWNSMEPISYVYQNMLKQFKKHRWTSFGNVSFIWDGDLYSGTQRPDLKAMIEDLKKRWFGVTAYYINDGWSNLIQYYFGTPQDGGAVYAWDSGELSKKIIEAHKTHLKKKIRKYIK